MGSVIFGRVRLAVFGRYRNIFSDKDGSAPLENLVHMPMKVTVAWLYASATL